MKSKQMREEQAVWFGLQWHQAAKMVWSLIYNMVKLCFSMDMANTQTANFNRTKGIKNSTRILNKKDKINKIGIWFKIIL